MQKIKKSKKKWIYSKLYYLHYSKLIDFSSCTWCDRGPRRTNRTWTTCIIIYNLIFIDRWWKMGRFTSIGYCIFLLQFWIKIKASALQSRITLEFRMQIHQKWLCSAMNDCTQIDLLETFIHIWIRLPANTARKINDISIECYLLASQHSTH